MASITFTTDQALLDLIVEAACALYGYQARVPDPSDPGGTIPNPQTPGQFAQQTIVRFCNDMVAAHKSQLAAEAARKQAVADLDAQVAAAGGTTVTVLP